MPAEWEPHDAVWLGWEERHLNYEPVAVEIIKNLSPHVKVKVTVSSDSILQIARAIVRKSGVDSSKLEFLVIPGSRYWIRTLELRFW